MLLSRVERVECRGSWVIIFTPEQEALMLLWFGTIRLGEIKERVNNDIVNLEDIDNASLTAID